MVRLKPDTTYRTHRTYRTYRTYLTCRTYRTQRAPWIGNCIRESSQDPVYEHE